MASEIEQELDISVDTLCTLLCNKNVSVLNPTLDFISILSTDNEKCRYVYNSPKLVQEILNVSVEHKNDKIGKIALDVIINITSIEQGAIAVYNLEAKSRLDKPVMKFLQYIIDKNCALAEHACKILVNMTVPENLVSKIVQDFLIVPESLRCLFECICLKNYNVKGCLLSSYLCQCFANLTQCDSFQKYLFSADNGNLFCSILSLISVGETMSQKTGILSAVYNCLYNNDHHKVLLSEPFEILPKLLLPLAGPEEFNEDEMDKMPIELQYLDETKEREKNPTVRNLLLKSLMLLCATRDGRTFLYDKETYAILREYHLWEYGNETNKDNTKNEIISKNLLACENIVNILKRTEDEIGVDDIRSLDVSDDLKKQFEKEDNDYINTIV